MRPRLSDTFFDVAKTVAERSTCPRLHVGAVLVKSGHIISTGYNGSEPGAPHCTDVGCFMVKGHCKNTIHAELNAILIAAKYGICTQDTDIYLTHSPCTNCAMLLRTAGVKNFYYLEEFTNND